MATVIGVTAQRAQAIEDASVVGASIQGNNLVLVTYGGTTINAGRVIPPPVTNYAVGSLYFTDQAANPSTYMGGGTWVRWGKGRVPVGVDENDPDFSMADQTSGEKTHLLTASESGIPLSNMVRQFTGGGNYYNVSSDMDSTHRSVLVGPSPAQAAHNNLQPGLTCYIWKRTA